MITPRDTTRDAALDAVRQVLASLSCSPFAIAADLERWYAGQGVTRLDVARLIVADLQRRQ